MAAVHSGTRPFREGMFDIEGQKVPVDGEWHSFPTSAINDLGKTITGHFFVNAKRKEDDICWSVILLRDGEINAVDVGPEPVAVEEVDAAQTRRAVTSRSSCRKIMPVVVATLAVAGAYLVSQMPRLCNTFRNS